LYIVFRVSFDHEDWRHAAAANAPRINCKLSRRNAAKQWCRYECVARPATWNNMEKVENLYRTARGQNAMPRRRDQMAGSG
jgi:hypothetical protein